MRLRAVASGGLRLCSSYTTTTSTGLHPPPPPPFDLYAAGRRGWAPPPPAALTKLLLLPYHHSSTTSNNSSSSESQDPSIIIPAPSIYNTNYHYTTLLQSKQQQQLPCCSSSSSDYNYVNKYNYGQVTPRPLSSIGSSGGGGRALNAISLHHHPYYHLQNRHFFRRPKEIKNIPLQDAHSQRAVTTALWCNFLVFSLKFGVWLYTSSHVMLAEVVHSVADFANQALLAYGLSSSRRAPDALHPYGYSKERFVWSLISAVGIFCLGSGATIVHGIQHLWTSHPPDNIQYAALVIGGSFLIEGASLVVAIDAVRKGAAAEGMKLRDYIWRGHDPTAVAVMTEDGAAVTGLLIAGASLVAVNVTGNPIYDPIGSIVVGNLLGMVAIFLIQRNRHALIGRAMDHHDMERVLHFLRNDPVVDSLYDCKSEVIGPGFFRFKAEIDFNGVVLVQNYLSRTGREEWARQFREAAEKKDDAAMLKIMSNYGEEVVTALGSEVDRLEKEIQEIVPGIRHVDIEAHNPIVPSPP